MKRTLLIVAIVVGVLGLAGIGLAKWGVGKYNNLITLGQEVDKSWGQVENVMQRRNDLIPNLVNIVQAYAIHEQEVFIKVAEARAQWSKTLQNGTISDKMKADEVIRGALFNLMAVVEKYPDLKANQNFLALQDELAGSENRVAVERMRYNETVQGYNTFAKKFPTNSIIGFFNLPAERDYFKAVEGAEKAPQINIAYPQTGAPAAAAPAEAIQAPAIAPAQ
jgi:LemA protein